MRSGKSFRPDFETSAGSFCFLSWRPPLRPRLRPIASSGVVSVLGPLVSFMAALVRGAFAFTGAGCDVSCCRGEQSPGRASTEHLAPAQPSLPARPRPVVPLPVVAPPPADADFEQPAETADKAAAGEIVAGPGASERDRLIDAMERAGWAQAKAARILGLTPRVARHRVLVISATSKTLAAAVLVTGAVASEQDLPIYLTGLSAVQASFAEGERVVVNSQYKLRQNSKVTVTLPAQAVGNEARAS
jgi:hypothetical protein